MSFNPLHLAHNQWSSGLSYGSALGNTSGGVWRPSGHQELNLGQPDASKLPAHSTFFKFSVLNTLLERSSPSKPLLPGLKLLANLLPDTPYNFSKNIWESYLISRCECEILWSPECGFRTIL